MDSTLEAARTLVAAAREVVNGALARLARVTAVDDRVDLALLDREQLLAYDLASAAAMVGAATELLDWGQGGELQADLTLAFAGHVTAEVGARTQGRHTEWAVDGLPWSSGPEAEALAAARAPVLLERIADAVVAAPDLPREASEELELARRTFRDFADAKVKPVAEAVHREDRDVPEELITELAAMGAFGLSVPEDYGGFAAGAAGGHEAADLLAMVVVTEELSRGSLGAAGSLITRPEILAQALLAGGTEDQRRRWLPAIATGERMCAVAVTEPDHGSDVANLTVTAAHRGDDYVVNGVKTWCTFAGRAELLMLLARSGSPAEGHRGLSLFVVEKPPYPGHDWVHTDGRGRLTARAIGTIGYRGMHSFELSFEDFHVPAANLVGGEAGLGRGFYLQLGAFANGRLQTAARALGVMQAAFEDAAGYAAARHVFGVPLADYQLSRAKLATMAYLIAACRWFTHRTAERLAAGQRGAATGGGAPGELEAAMAKSLACRAAEWVTREAQQLHGGYGYAEEYAVSRYFVDARVLPLFEGADEALALRMIIRRLLTDALDADP